jgi:hypothetical protein
VFLFSTFLHYFSVTILFSTLLHFSRRAFIVFFSHYYFLSSKFCISIKEEVSNVGVNRTLTDSKKTTRRPGKEGGDVVPFAGVMESYGARTRTVEHMAELIQEAAVKNCMPQPLSKQTVLNELAIQLQRGVSLGLIKAMAAARKYVGHWVN